MILEEDLLRLPNSVLLLGDPLSTHFPLAPPAIVTISFLTLGVLTAMVAFLVWRKQGRAWLLTHARGSWFATATGLLAALTVLTALLGFLAASAYLTSIEITRGKLVVAAPPLAHAVIYEEEIAEAFVADWDEDTSLRPVVRTAGTSIGSYKTGWFKLSNGSPALLVTSSSRNLCIRTTQGVYLLLHPEDFAELLEQFNNTLASQLDRP